MPRKDTRNAQGGGTIRKRDDGRWEARYTVGRHPGTGRQIQKSVYGNTQAEVRKKLQQVCTEIDEGIYIEPSKLTLGAWLDIWLAEYTGNLKGRSRELYKNTIEHRIKPALGAIKLSALNTPTIQAFYNALHKGENGSRPLSPKTIKNTHGILHKALQQAVGIGYMRFNPSGACNLPRIEKAEIKPMYDRQIAEFLQAIKGHPLETLFIVDIFTGMRQGEIIGLTWDCVNQRDGTIYLYRQLQIVDRQYQFTPLKNDKTRTITPAPYVMELLRNYRKTQDEWRLQAGSLWEGGDFVFTNEVGKHLARQTVYKSFKRIVKELGIADTRFHDMRHSYAVASIQAGDDIKTVQENLGHHTAAFTLDVYGHVSEKMKRDSADRMEHFIKSLPML